MTKNPLAGLSAFRRRIVLEFPRYRQNARQPLFLFPVPCSLFPPQPPLSAPTFHIPAVDRRVPGWYTVSGFISRHMGIASSAAPLQRAAAGCEAAGKRLAGQFPGTVRSRAPRRQWRGDLPPLRESRGLSFEGQSGWYREAHLFVLEMAGAIYYLWR